MRSFGSPTGNSLGLLCAPWQGARSHRVRDPAGQLSLQPEALGAAQEETNGLKHSKRKASFGRSASRAGCNEQ